MSARKIFRRTLITLLTVSIMMFASVTHAEVYTGEGSYIMSKVETLEVARERAKADAMRNACEKAGTYVKSYTKIENLMLTEDVIETMTANIIKLIEKPIFQMLEGVDNLDGIMIRVTVKAQIDDSDITRWLNKDEQEKSELVAQMDALRKANEEQARQIEELKRQLATNPQDKERITKEFADADKIFLSNQKVDEGWKLWSKKDFNGAAKLFDEAIQLNPNNSEAWRGRGTAYTELKQNEQAIQDFNKAIELNPNHDMAYNNRGNVYQVLNQYERAIQDYNKAIELNPNDALSYTNRGSCYNYLGQNEQAIADYNKALDINPNDETAYYNRGNSYYDLGQYEQAIADYNKAVKLNPNYDVAYNNRGNSYLALDQYERAIADYDKAISINPNDALFYNGRGWAYYCLKKYQQALKDFDKALELNPNYTSAKNNRETCLKAMGK